MSKVSEEENTENTHHSDYRLDRDYFSECFDESNQSPSGLIAYRKAGLLFIIAFGLSLTSIDPYAAWFLLAMSTVEYLSVRYQRSWWIARQMFSRAAGSLITLTLDDSGISTASQLSQQHTSWAEVENIEETERGFIITSSKGRSYLSKNSLTTETRHYLKQQRS
jgi:hypothetical protein